MRRTKKIVLALLLLIVGVQFIQPARNQSGQVLPADFTEVYQVPQNIQAILRNACFDCHSNNTAYPWYARFQPGAWFMSSHINNGKGELNFSEFGNLSSRKQSSKLRGIANQIKDGDMPLTPYKWLHKNARLTGQDRKIIIEWMNKTADSLTTN